MCLTSICITAKGLAAYQSMRGRAAPWRRWGRGQVSRWRWRRRTLGMVALVLGQIEGEAFGAQAGLVLGRHSLLFHRGVGLARLAVRRPGAVVQIPCPLFGQDV